MYEIEEDGPVHCVKYRAQVTVHGTKYAGDWAGVQEDAELSAARCVGLSQISLACLWFHSLHTILVAMSSRRV